MGLPAACAAAAWLSAWSAAGPASAAEFVFGQADSLAIDQPRITFGLTDESTSPATLIGPTLQNLALLDTGANGVLLAGLSYVEGEDYGQPAFAFDYDGNGTIDTDEQLAQYAELGVAGTSLLDVHDPHGLRVLDSGGQELLIGADIRAFGDDQLNIGSFAAIVGMPAMDGHVIEIDMRPTLSFAFQDVFYHDTLGGAAFESAASMNVDLRIIDPEHTDPTLPPALRPTFAGLPVIDNIDMSHTGGADSGGATLAAEDYTFLLDTGAQTVIISGQMAQDMGIDYTRTLAQGGDILDFLEVGGIGGTLPMPLVLVDRFSMPTQGGVDLVYTDLIVGVLDIEGAPFDAVFGMNMLTTGYLAAAFGGGGGEVTDPLATPDLIELFIEAGTVNSTQDLFDFNIIRISEQEFQELVDVGLILDPDDPLEVFIQIRALEDLLSTPASNTLLDKVVLDFTRADGTATMRLDLSTVPLRSDADYNGRVDDFDILILISQYGKTVQPGVMTSGDLNGDGRVDDFDILLSIADYGQTTAPSAVAPVPEPGSVVVLSGLAGLLGLRRRR